MSTDLLVFDARLEKIRQSSFELGQAVLAQHILDTFGGPGGANVEKLLGELELIVDKQVEMKANQCAAS